MGDAPASRSIWDHPACPASTASYNNSILSARSFFQVGEVQPARSNDYGFKFGSRLGKNTNLTLTGSQRKLRGQVNGNVLVPAADERTVLASDPATRALVEAIIGAYPAQLPNRTDINPRALNTNAQQNINNDRIGAVLEHSWNEDQLAVSYNLTLQDVEAFQLVGGQNPDTITKNNRARLTWSRGWTPTTTTDFSAGYDRIGSLIVPEETSLGPFFLFGRILQSIGPSGSFPIDRAQNMFRYAGRLRHTRGNHLLTLGSEILRRQVNGFESNNHRGTFRFGRDFGRDPLVNLALGAPSSYRFAIGDARRGFRNWDMQFFAGDEWKVNANLTLNFGLRYRPVTAAAEVNGLSEIPYDCDCNNLAPRFGFAYRLSDSWGVIRGAYGIQYGEIFPATFMQSRFNPPEILSIDIRAPDLVNPFLGGARRGPVELGRPQRHQGPRSGSGVTLFAPVQLQLGTQGVQRLDRPIGVCREPLPQAFVGLVSEPGEASRGTAPTFRERQRPPAGSAFL